MFGQDWTTAETLYNIALAYATKIYDEANAYIVSMSYNFKLVICMAGGDHNANVDYANRITTC